MDLEAQTSSASGTKGRGKSEDPAKMADGFQKIGAGVLRSFSALG